MAARDRSDLRDPRVIAMLALLFVPLVAGMAAANLDPARRYVYLAIWIVCTALGLALAIRSDAAKRPGAEQAAADRAAQSGVDPDDLAALRTPIRPLELWGFWIPVLVLSVGAMAYLGTHDGWGRRSPAGLALFPPMAMLWWKARAVNPRRTREAPGARGFWASLPRRDRIAVVKFAVLGASVAGFGLARLAGGSPATAVFAALAAAAVAGLAGMTAIGGSAAPSGGSPLPGAAPMPADEPWRTTSVTAPAMAGPSTAAGGSAATGALGAVPTTRARAKIDPSTSRTVWSLVAAGFMVIGYPWLVVAGAPRPEAAAGALALGVAVVALGTVTRRRRAKA
ncbi:MAG: hypothetical protein AAGC46_12010 [Solirubrobacteraceae bacterium]|nr:hypothetical protein [Patulibacter sp.]